MKNLNLTKNNIIKFIAYLVLGILFCCMKSGVISVVITILGAFVIVLGILKLIDKKWLEGVLYIVGGVLMIIGSWFLQNVIVIIIGALFIALGAYRLIVVSKVSRAVQVIIGPVLMIVAGIFIICANWLDFSPRATLSLTAMAKAVAYVQRRDYVVPKDIQVTFPQVIAHRLLLAPEADARQIGPEQILAEILRQVPAPRL